jgi:hypothetical protein
MRRIFEIRLSSFEAYTQRASFAQDNVYKYTCANVESVEEVHLRYVV